ncbi:MAG: 30S ribosomal protein S4 [Bacteroidota bacterium]
MARYIGPKTKVSRKYGEYIKGNRKVFNKKKYPPGMHGQKKRKKSAYAIQQHEKQKLKAIYGIQEGKLRNLFKRATRMQGKTGELLLQSAERRLDNVVFRMLGLKEGSRDRARQFVSHKHIQVNGRTVNIASFSVSPGDLIRLTPKAQKNSNITEGITGVKEQYTWLTWDQEKHTGTFVAIPTREDIPEKIDEKSIVELYSR